MIFALDMDDTITAEPEFFSVLAQALRAQGHKVYIITARPDIMRKQTELYLSNRNIPHDGVHFVTDKLEAANKLGVDFAFDDMPMFYYRGDLVTRDDDKIVMPFKIIKVNK